MNKKKIAIIILGVSILIILIIIIGSSNVKSKHTSAGTGGKLPLIKLKETPPLKDQFDFPIGVAVKHPDLFTDERKSALIKHHFNSITAEYIMKPPYVQPVEGTFNFVETDQHIRFAKENNMRLRGHTLVWHNDCQEWMFKDLPDDPISRRGLLLKRMEEHITNVIAYSGDDIERWDVVNEAIGDSQPFGMRKSDFYNLIGPDYVEQAFIMADEVRKRDNLKTKLYYNDYNNQEDSGKRAAILKLVTDLVEKGIPLDGVGLQGHIGNEFGNIEGMEQSLRGFLELGLEVELTELDITVYPNHEAPNAPIAEEALIQQAYRYKEVVDLLKKLNTEYPGKIAGITFWGLTDDGSWLNNFVSERTDMPLVFDKEDQPKLAYWAMVDPSRLPPIVKTVSSYKGTPIIGEMVDLKWDIAKIEILKDNNENPIGSFQTLWDDKNLYVLAIVKDKQKDPNDKIEFFIESNLSKRVHYSVKRDKNTISTPEGYMAAVAIPMAKQSEDIGFEITIHLGDDSITRYAKLVLEDYKHLEALKGVPVIDGEIDDIWLKTDQIKTEVITKEGTATGDFRALWNENYLYILAEVKDENLYAKEGAESHEQDSVEFFIDENYERTNYYQPDDTQYRVNYKNKRTFLGENCKEENIVSATQITSTGYIVETAIKLNSINQIIDGQIIGFDVQVNDDSTGDGKRNGQANWNDTTGDSWKNTSVFGSLRFVEDY